MILNIFKTSILNKLKEFAENGGLKSTLRYLLILYFAVFFICLKAGFAPAITINIPKNNIKTAISIINQDKLVNNSPILAAGIVTGETIAGFTLAEVLITLLIIGIVASLVIPNLINDTQNQEYKVAWKKAYAEISQAVSLYVKDNGGTFIGPGSFYTKAGAYLDIMKVCSNTKECFAWHVMYPDGTIYLDSTNYQTAVLKNGITMFDGENRPNCNGKYGGHVPACSHIFVDINGLKGPNTLGKDINSLMVLSNGIVKPSGDPSLHIWNATPGDCFQSGSTGMSCAAQYLYQ